MTTTLHPSIERARATGVSLDMHGPVAVVRLCRPTKRNALKHHRGHLRALVQDLRAEVQQI